MKKIILVEDDEGLIDIYREVFQHTGFDIEVARTAKEIKGELDHIMCGLSKMPDLILLDIMLPDAKGTEILRIAKQDPELKRVPVFVLTNYENPDTQKELERQNIKPEKYLIKVNHNPSELIGIINDYFRETA